MAVQAPDCAQAAPLALCARWQFLLLFHGLDPCEEYWSVLQNVLSWGLSDVLAIG